ncbi:hypothetical protein HPB50_014259 [Hyalomma asiaticum]|uniref:Uncharacterized protein n=1 Tax=Hyalomma asiaticum TaxID=266040 RepID=A0ACB7RUB4_HYAAI|nr:hypothetical protein HPB50_014259 [Hyalomma asiaticum]
MVPLAGAAATVLFVAFKLMLRRDVQVNSGPVCDSYDCQKHAFDVAGLLNSSGRPCDDFAGYVCPAWPTTSDATVSVLQDVAYAYSNRLVLTSLDDLRVPDARGPLAMIHSCVNRSREDSQESLRALREFLNVDAVTTSDPLVKLIDLAVNWHLPILFNVALLPVGEDGSDGGRLIYIFPSELLEMLFTLQKALVTHGLFDQAWENLPLVTGVRYENQKGEILYVLLDVLADMLNATDTSLEDPVFVSVQDLPALNSSAGWLTSLRMAFNVTPAITGADSVVVTHQSMLDALVRAFGTWKNILANALQWLVSEYACFLACTNLVQVLPSLKGAPAAHTIICVAEVEATHGTLLNANSRELQAFEKYYKDGPKIVGDTFFQKWMSVREFVRAWDPAERYQLPTVKRRTLSSTLVYYDPPTHAVVVSPASVESPLYYRGGTKAMTLGGLGFLIATQLIRSLVYGIDLRRANASASIEFHEVLREKRHCGSDGEATLRRWFPGAAALDSLEDYLHDGGRRIKGLEQFTERQVFFLTACHVTCVRGTDAVYSRECNDAVKNSVSFAGAFRCREGSHMNYGGKNQEKGDGAAVLAASIKAPDAREEDAKRENIVQATTEACAGGPAKEGLDMECEESATPAVGKRQLEVSEENGKPEASAGEPLPKAQFTRRPTLKIQPKVPPDRRATPPAAKTMPADPP